MAFVRDTLPLTLLVILLLLWTWSSKHDENITIKGIIRKFFWYMEGIIFMCTAKDSKGIGKKLQDPDLIEKSTKTYSKRIIFVRHGESEWNEVFK